MIEEPEKVPSRAPVARIQLLLDVIASLRGPGGCPWDQKQTHATLARYAVEEACELADAIADGDDSALREELGDVLLQVLLHSQLASERGAFNFQAVADGLADKMIRRHPHVFSNGTAEDAARVEQQWKARKRAEGRSVLGGVPRSMPSMARAMHVSERAAAVGFDFPDAASAAAKVQEERAELSVALAEGDVDEQRAEFGDLLFAVVNWGRKLGLNADECLGLTVDKFVRRFGAVEAALAERGRTPEESTLDEMESLWVASKKLPVR